MSRRFLSAAVSLTVLAACAAALPPAPRNIVISAKSFVSRASNQTVLLKGANVVMKASPWLPPVTGDTLCSDHWYSNFTCYAFTQRDAAHITGDMGWNFIRLGVVWAGAQPKNEPELDPEWLSRLHALLDLAAQHGIHVLLDVHQDDVGTATCGEGVPQWFSALATPSRIGKPIRPLPFAGGEFPHQPDGLCGTNDTKTWALYAGSDEYSITNPCCVRYNGGGNSWARMEFTWEAQETVHYLFRNKVGRAYYTRYIGLLAAAVRDYPAAFGIELMNEPPSIERDAMYATWQVAARMMSVPIDCSVLSAAAHSAAALSFTLLALALLYHSAVSSTLRIRYLTVLCCARHATMRHRCPCLTGSYSVLVRGCVCWLEGVLCSLPVICSLPTGCSHTLVISSLPQAELPGIAIGIMDTGEAPLPIGDLGLWPSQVK